MNSSFIMSGPCCPHEGNISPRFCIGCKLNVGPWSDKVLAGLVRVCVGMLILAYTDLNDEHASAVKMNQ